MASLYQALGPCWIAKVTVVFQRNLSVSSWHDDSTSGFILEVILCCWSASSLHIPSPPKLPASFQDLTGTPTLRQPAWPTPEDCFEDKLEEVIMYVIMLSFSEED